MASKGYHHMTHDTRCQIYILKSTGMSYRAIGKAVGYHASSISRELSRNRGKRGYRVNQADKLAQQRRSCASQQHRRFTPSLQTIVRHFLCADYSPEQIAGRLTRQGKPISYETIYQFIWRDKRSGGQLYKKLRHRGKRYNKRASTKAGRGCIPGRVDISERPAVVDSKVRIGDWEGDTIVGAKHKGAIVSYVDRHSKYTLLKKVKRRTAECVTQATIDCLAKVPHPVRTITYDNGKEFSAHQKIAQALNTRCYFATPYHSWERGLNEHTNGLVRQYIPKSTSFDMIDDDFIKTVQNKLNHRPRKVLNFRTPFEVFHGIDTYDIFVALQI